MSILISEWIHTPNDLLRRLMGKHGSATPNYWAVAQSTEDILNFENAPAVSMGPYFESAQISLLRTL